MMRTVNARLFYVFCCALGLSACATSAISRHATLLSGIKEYQGDMQSLGSPSRWPDRQRAGGTLKDIITVTVGVSPEFYRLVDLDIRKREFEITLRETHVSDSRAREMKDELTQMDEEIAALKPVIRTQLASLRLTDEAGPGVEDAAARGLLNVALEEFSSNGRAAQSHKRSSTVAGYLVTDLGSFAAVRAPDGQRYRCVVVGVAEEGAAMKCESLK